MAVGEHKFVTIPRKNLDYEKLNQNMANTINPQGAMYEKILPLLMQSKFEGELKQRQQDALIDRLTNGGNGAKGNFKLSVGPSGITYTQKSDTEILKDKEAAGDLAFLSGKGQPQQQQTQQGQGNKISSLEGNLTLQEILANTQGTIPQNQGQGVPQGVPGAQTPPDFSHVRPSKRGDELSKWRAEQRKVQQDIDKEERSLELARKKEIIKGVSGEVGGRIALAKESTKNVEEIKKILFVDNLETGELKMNRGLAFLANIPMGQLPILGRMIPDVAPQYFASIPWLTGVDSKDIAAAQNLYRKLSAIISGRQLIQTGVAARPEETARLVSQFSVNSFSNPDAAMAGLNELNDFYKDYITETDPAFRLGGKTFKKQDDPLGIR